MTLYILLQDRYAGLSPTVTAVVTSKEVAEKFLAFDPRYRCIEEVSEVDQLKEVRHIEYCASLRGYRIE